MKLHAKYQRPGPSSFRQEDFKALLKGVYVEKNEHPVKNVKVNLISTFFSSIIGSMSPMLHTIGPRTHVPNAAYYWPFASGDNNSNTIYERGVHLGHVVEMRRKLSFPLSMMALCFLR